jgi:hypothetical protein
MRRKKVEEEKQKVRMIIKIETNERMVISEEKWDKNKKNKKNKNKNYNMKTE